MEAITSPGLIKLFMENKLSGGFVAAFFPLIIYCLNGDFSPLRKRFFSFSEKEDAVNKKHFISAAFGLHYYSFWELFGWNDF